MDFTGSDALSYKHSSKVKFKAHQREFQVTVDPLTKRFKMEDEIARNSFFDFVGPVESHANRGTTRRGFAGQVGSETEKDFLTPFRVNADTPDAVVPKWRRRVNAILSDKLRISIPRAHAKTLGRSVDSLVDIYKKEMMSAMARSYLQQTLALITFPYVESPIIRVAGAVSTGVPTTQYFSDKYRHMFKYPETNYVSASPKTYKSPGKVQKFFYLTASLQNYMKIGANTAGINAESGIKRGKCLFICNNTAWAVWKDVNFDIIGHRDYFGKPIALGMAKLYEFQDYEFLVLPDDIFLNVTTNTADIASEAVFDRTFEWNLDPTNDNYLTVKRAGGTNSPRAVTFPNPAAWDGLTGQLLDAVKGAGNMNTFDNHALTTNMYKFLVVETNGFRLQKPQQFNFAPILYKDKDKSFETFQYGEWSMEGIRPYDGLCREVYMSADEMSIAYK